jgi:geranylgeranyl reductase family protein
VDEPYDIAIVGAGPAGATAAYDAARRGLRVALIDRQTFPRDKPCGDGIGPGAVTIARQLGLSDIFAHDIPVTAVTVAGPDGTQLDTATSDMGNAVHGYIVPRRDFDKRLLDRALSQNAADLTGRKFIRTSITGQTRTIELQEKDNTRCHITARLLIGADGANSVVRKALGAPASTPRHTGLAMRAYARTDAFNPGGQHGPRMLFSFSRDLLPSYAWLFPTGQGTVNIGAGGPLTEIRKTHQDPRHLIAAYVGQLRAQGIDFSEPYAHRAHHLPHFGGMPALTHPRAALIGDAASMINPFSGEGIAYGMTAAARLIESLPDDLTSSQALQNALTRFEHDFRRAYRAHIASTLLLHKLMRSPSWAKLFIGAAEQDPAVLHDAIELLFGFGRAHLLTSARILRTRWHSTPAN